MISLDKNRPIGRPTVTVLDDDSTLVCWLRRADGHSQLRAARVMKDGRIAAQLTIAKVAAGRASGFPRVTADGLAGILCWTSGKTPNSTVRATRISFER